MVLIASIHSFRGGTGKSNTPANVATILLGSRSMSTIEARLCVG
jgi:MinD-like ATPase involved in chromosome partitioning or flagellar assembly